MRSVDEHVAACLALALPPDPAPLPLSELLDTVLAEDVASSVDLPPFDNSAMDGYAVVLADLRDAAEAAPAVLPVDLDLPAGAPGLEPLLAGRVARIMTGAPLPAGAEAVVPVEWTDAGTRRVAIRRAPSAGQFVRRVGEDVRRGDVLIAAGTRLSPRHVALIAAIGRREVRVVPRPKVAVVSTGSELAEPGSSLRPGQVYESNAYGLVAAARELGAEAFRVGIVTDDAQALAARLAELAGEVDLVITSGGVSAGAFEPVKQVFGAGGVPALASAPGSVEFVKVAMQPGMPQGLGVLRGGAGRRGTPIVTLPGNPVSSMLSFEVFVAPMIRRMRGEAQGDWFRPQIEATATQGWSSPAGKRQFMRGRLDGEPEAPTATPVGRSGSHLAAALAQATCLIVVPEDETLVEPGDTLRCMVLDRIAR